MAIVFLVLLIFTQPADSIKPSPPAGEHLLGEEVITAETEIKISDPKISFPPRVDPWTPIKDLMAPGNYVFDEALFKSIDSMTIPNRFMRSSFLRVPVEKSFIYGDILVFLPSFEKRVATWELVIANSLGETVRRVKQKGQPPAVITWDGRTDSGEPIATGDVYSFTFNAYDAQGNQTRIICEPQRVDAIVWQQGQEWIVSVAADRLFAANGAQLVEQAGSHLDEIANVVKERFKKEVVVYVYSEREQLATERCRVIGNELGRRMVLPKEALKVAPRFIPGLQPKHSKIEIHII